MSPVSRGLYWGEGGVGGGTMLGLSLKALAVRGLSLVALSRAYSPAVVLGLLLMVASLAAEHRL